MANKTFRVIFYITDQDNVAITSGASPIAIRDSDQSQTPIGGTHIANGLWYFDIPSGWPGCEIMVETAAATYTRDAYLSGPALTGNKLGLPLVPVVPVED